MWIVPYFLTETLRLRLFSLLTHLLSYQAPQRHTDFIVNSEGISFEAEPFTSWYRAEVRAVRAVVPTGNGNKLAAENLRVALLGSWWNRLDENVVSFLITCEHTLVVLTNL